MAYVTSAALLVAGLIHIIPLTGVIGAKQLTQLYGVELVDPNLIILMRHRAVLFALLGLFLILAAFRPSLQALATIAGLISTISFLALAWTAEEYNQLLARVVVVDIVAIACLLLAGVILSLKVLGT